MTRRRQAEPVAPPAGLRSACPAWCTADHDDNEPRHLAELLDVAATADGTAEHTPRVYLDLRRGPDDDGPLIHMDLDERPVARMRPWEAAELGAKMIELARLTGAAEARPIDRHGGDDRSQASAPVPPAPAHDASKSARMRIVTRYARRQRNGRVLFCSPSKAELGGEMPRRETSGSDGKVVFPDLETAEAAARELEALGGGPQRAYICRRSRHGHAHLTGTPWGGPSAGGLR
ncbi:hypothetical protein ACIBI9_04280 [Nonomuraea sp. NPDC050451]|uniref:hypothetical protein n=1 Tax=Nonomuraea sp. NPDC050451 TaxID=3364364 RepID=UPI0037B3333C